MQQTAPLHAGLPFTQHEGLQAVRQSALHEFRKFEVQPNLTWVQACGMFAGA